MMHEKKKTKVILKGKHSSSWNEKMIGEQALNNREDNRDNNFISMFKEW